MSKKIYIEENNLVTIKNAMANKNISHSILMPEDKPPYEEDEFEIGSEGGNNDFFHINENTFEKWFGGSILKDEEGNPLKMYHGTDAAFDSFSKEHIGRTGAYEGYGFNFTPFYGRAASYNSKNVIEAYLRAEHPMTTKDYKITPNKLAKIIAKIDEGSPFTDTIVAAYEPARYNEKWDEKYYRRALPIAAMTIYRYNKESGYGDAGIYAEVCLNGNGDKFKVIDVFEELGYDSVIHYDNDGRINTVVVFEPNQIKLVGNKTYKLDSDIMGENTDKDIVFDNYGMSINNEKILDKYNLKDLVLSKTGNYVTLNKIVAKEFEKGYGSKFMEELVKIADKNGWVLTLTPDTSFGGTSIHRLKNFYKRFGFVDNKGKGTDFSTREAMIRKPITENIETEVESSEVNLDSFKKNSELAPKMWDGFDLDPRARLKLLDIADDFWDFANITWVKRKGIHLTGSICNFNWSKYSDIDLHIVVDFSEIDERKDFVQEYFNSKKNEWNDKHSKLKIYDYPVELYVEDVNAEAMSGGLYDLEENKWIKKPSSDNIKEIGLDKYEIKSKSAKFMTMIDDLYDEFNSTDDDAVLREIGKKAHRLLNRIKRMRKYGLNRGGESDSYNVVFKVLRRSGYMEMLYDLSSELYDKINSISLDESLIREEFDLFGAAKQHFGITNNLRECGFILPDGTMLDLSGRHLITGDTDTSFLNGRRTSDHRSVEELNNENTPYITLSKFIEAGAIRCDLRGAFINLIKRPTKEQISVLSRFITKLNGDVQLEIGNDDISIDYVEYNGVGYRRIINDILNFFDNKVKPSSLYECIKKVATLNEEVVADGKYKSIIKHIIEEINRKKLVIEENGGQLCDFLFIC